MKFFLPILSSIFIASGGFASEKPEYLDSFDPAKGFKPAQRDLTEIFLQLAGSLECYGSPEPYLRHVAEEDARVEKMYSLATGKQTSMRPAFLTDEALDRFAKNWNQLAQKLGFKDLAKQIGANIRTSLTAPKDSPNGLQSLVVQHQKSIYSRLTEKNEAGGPGSEFSDSVSRLADKPGSPFSAVRERLTQISTALDAGLSKSDAERVKAFISDAIYNTGLAADSEFEAGYVAWALVADKSSKAYDVAQETRLSTDERHKFAALLVHDHFTKADFPRMDAFYSSSAYDRLSEAGKDQLSMRFWAGIRGSGTR